MRLKTKLIIIAAVTVLFGTVLITVQQDRGAGFRAAFDAEFLARPDGYPGLKKRYGLEFPARPMQMDPGLMYRALKDRAVSVINGFATDGRIPAYNLVILEDDKGFFPPYYAAPVIRKDTLERYPELETILNSLANRITDQKMRSLNYTVDKKGMRASETALDFLVSEGLLPADRDPPFSVEGSVAVGGKHFTEQEILGEMISLLIEHTSGIRVRRFLNLGGTVICFNALRAGDIDIYVEYTGTALINILRKEILSDPEEVFQSVQNAFDDQFDILWLSPLGFNNTYTLTMREDEAEKLGIKSISDLTRHLQARR